MRRQSGFTVYWYRDDGRDVGRSFCNKPPEPGNPGVIMTSKGVEVLIHANEHGLVVPARGTHYWIDGRDNRRVEARWLPRVVAEAAEVRLLALGLKGATR